MIKRDLNFFGHSVLAFECSMALHTKHTAGSDLKLIFFLSFRFIISPAAQISESDILKLEFLFSPFLVPAKGVLSCVSFEP